MECTDPVLGGRQTYIHRCFSDVRSGFDLDFAFSRTRQRPEEGHPVLSLLIEETGNGLEGDLRLLESEETRANIGQPKVVTFHDSYATCPRTSTPPVLLHMSRDSPS